MNSRSVLLTFVLTTGLVPASAFGMASAELYSTNAYFYGRFDARIQFAPGDGVVSSFFLWKDGSDAANAYWNELDYEKVGADCHMQINNIYGNPKTQHQQTPTLSNTCAGYHDYRFEWTPTYIAWVVDGKEIRRDTGADATAYAQNASAGMSFHFNIWPGNSSFGGNINNTTLPVHQYISWVEYSSYDNGNFNVQWHEDFQSSGTPSGWAVGNWASPFNLSTHNPQNVAFVDGIAVLSLTADNATGTPGTPPADNGTGGAGGTGGSGGGAGSGGAMSTGGSSAGGVTGSGGRTSTGGTTSTSGSTNTGGSTSSSGSTSTGGTTGSGRSSGTGGTAASGGTTSSGGNSSSGGTTTSGNNPGTGGMTATGGSIGAGGATATGSTTATGGAANGGSAGTTTAQGGCSCSTAPATSPLGPALLVLLIVFWRLRRQEI